MGPSGGEAGVGGGGVGGTRRKAKQNVLSVF